MPKHQTEIDVDHPAVEAEIGERPSRASFPSVFRRGSPAKQKKVSKNDIQYQAEPAHPVDPETSTGGPPIKLISFILIVVIPFIASVIYFGFIASDQYTAEARFAVRSVVQGGSGDNPEGSVLNMQAASQDAYVVTSFIHSAEVLKRISDKIDYRAIFARNGADFLSRFSLKGANEDFLKYWDKQVTSYIDGPSGIITLKVQTFNPEDSVKLASLILEESETLVNQLSDRARNDLVKSVQADVQRAGKAYGDTLAALNQFQNQSGLLSPADQAQQSGKLLTGLLGQKLELETRLFVARQSSAEESPAYQQLNSALQSIDNQITALRAQLTGPENQSIATALVKFSELETNRLVAEKLYESARRNYDAAVTEAMRKSVYLAVFVHPSLPQEALYPLRIASPLMILLGLIVFWATIMLAWASVEDHRL